MCEKGSVGPAVTTPYLQVLFIFICDISLSNSRWYSANADVVADLKSKIIVSRRHLFADVIVLPLQKFKTIKRQQEKNPYTQTNTYLLHISKNFKGIFKCICFTLYLKQTVNNSESTTVFINHCCLPYFFPIVIRSNEFRVDLII